MVRMIDADKLIEEIESYRGDIFSSEIVELIKQMPTVGEWIPCSERMPEKHTVLCDVFYRAEYEVDEDYHDIQILTYVGDGEFRNSCGNNLNVIASMPLPEPYRLQEDER